MQKSPWVAVKGKNFRSFDLAQWKESQYITFLQFCAQFMIPSDEGPKLSYKPELWLNAEKILSMPDHPFIEYFYRIDRFSMNGGTVRQFHKKLQDMMQGVLKFIQTNPSVVSDEMRKILEMYPRMAWCLKQTDIVQTAMGVDVVVPKNNTVAFDERLYNAGVKVVDVLERLADSITDKDIKEMSARDKMIAMGRMGYIFTIAKNLKPNKQIFNQININASSREDLEAALLGTHRQ